MVFLQFGRICLSVFVKESRKQEARYWDKWEGLMQRQWSDHLDNIPNLWEQYHKDFDAGKVE
jgi:hypothetical protein